MCLGSRPADEMIGLAREFGFSELETFLEAAASVEGDFDWQRDVIDQVDAPTLPPPPRDNEIATSVASDAIVGDVMTRDGDILPLAASSSAATADAVDDEHCPWNGPEAPRDDDTAAGEHPTSLSAERFTGATGEVAADKLAAAERLEAKEVVVPQPPVPNPGAASDVSPHPADAARLSWQRAMGLLEVLAAGARTMEPDPAVLREAVNLGRVARAALRAWEVTRTRLIDAWPTAQRARDILERLRGLQRAPNFDDALPIVAGPIMVERGIQQEAELLLDQAACALDEAIDKQRASLDMFAKGDLNLLAAMVALNDQADQAMALTVSRIGAATATLTDAVARLAQAPLESRVGSLATRITPPIQQAATVSAKETSYTDWNPPVSDAASCPEMDTDRDGEIHTESARTDRNHDSTLPEATGARGSLELAIALEASAVDVAAPELRAELDPIEDPGFEFVEAAAVDDELLADTEAASTALPPGPPPVEQSAPPQDPLISEIEAKLEAFIGTHAFGVAYHLSRAAAQVFRGGRANSDRPISGKSA